MAQSFIFFRSVPFSNKIAKEELEQLLTTNNVPFEVEENSYAFDSSFANNEFSKDYQFKIRKEDFERVNTLLEEQTKNIIDNLPADYYLFSFSRQELMEVVHKPDEWNEIDVALATKLLKEKGASLEPQELNEIKQERIAELQVHTPIKKGTMIAAYCCAILAGSLMIPLGIFAFYAGPAASLFGLALMISKKTMPDGTRIYTYAPQDRKHGLILLILGVVCAFAWLPVLGLVLRSYPH